MKKQNRILLALLYIIIIVVLIAPVSAGLNVTDGAKITSPYGVSSPVITITGSDIPADGTITIDVSSLYLFINSGLFKDANVMVSSNAAAATWSGAVSGAGDAIILTSTGGNTTIGENITVIFTGAGGNRWVTDTYGDQSMGLTVTRTDTAETASITFMIETVTPPPGGLTITDGNKITSSDGTSSPVITIIDSDIPAAGTIIIDVPYLWTYVKSGIFTNVNVIVNDTAAAATWTGTVSAVPGVQYSDYITLKSTGGPTVVGENITVTFTGAGGNPWVPNTFGDQSTPLTVTRTDTAQTGSINFMIDTVPPSGGLSIANGTTITTMLGTTSPVITITDNVIPAGGAITIDKSGLNTYVASGTLTDANVLMNDTAASATWTRAVAGNTLTLVSTGGPTAIGENITVTFTGAEGNPWIPNTHGIQTIPLTATRTDTSKTGTFNFVINTVPPSGGLTIANGTTITTELGSSSPVITVADNVIPAGGTITIDVSGLNPYVANGTLTDTNVEINDTAAIAHWTRAVTGNILTLTSTGGNTAIGENVTITFTGAGGNPWISNTHGTQTIPLTVIRTDTGQTNTFNFMIETAHPAGLTVVANFTASPTSDMAPLAVTFTDTSLGNPTSWNWDFGDGSTSTLQHPDHTYLNIGMYTVSLNATNAYSSDTITQWNYIRVLGGAVMEAHTNIPGLTMDNCGDPQMVTVNTSVLSAALVPDNFVLEIQPPAESGFKHITMNANNRQGFAQTGNLIFGYPGSVHLVTEEIAPSSGFSADIGTNASFNYSIDLPSYPCNALLSTKIWGGAVREYDNKLRRIVDGNNVSVVGTAYTAKISKTNFPSDARVKLHMSVNSSWNTYPNLPGGPGMMFIWRIADDGNSGQILPTNHLYSAPVNNLDYYDADSPRGGSTFGLSSFTGNNNPFQVITFIAAKAVNPNNGGGEPSSATRGGGSGGGGSSVGAQTTTAPVIKAPAVQDSGKTAKIHSNDQGIISQVTTLMSADGLVNISLGMGIVAKDGNGNPLSSIGISRMPPENLPAVSPGTGMSFTGMAYDLQPDKATFSPSIALSFAIPTADRGVEYVIHEYDNATDTWQALPGSYNPQKGIITAQISRFCVFALFAKTPVTEQTVAPAQTIIVSSKSSVSTDVGMYSWFIATVGQNPVIIVIILAALAAVAYFGWWKKRL